MATQIQGIPGTAALARNGKPKTDSSGQQKRAGQSGDGNASVGPDHTVELSAESRSKAQKMVTGSGYIASSDLEDIDFSDEEALELANGIARQMEKTAGGLITSPSAELAGMLG
jgi:hypothetical protein